MVNLPLGVDIHNLIDDLRIFSWEAAEIFFYYSQILKKSEKKNEIVKNKNMEDPVTHADLEVNELILKRMCSKYPNIDWQYLSEENAKIDLCNCDRDSDWLWILDPLDGTKDFIQGTRDYAMHFALNYKRKPLLGVVLIPEKDELWISNGEKTWCEGKDGSKKKINTFINKNLSDMTLVSSKNHSNPALKKLIEKINFSKTISMGSIGCKIASIIRGESDLYICLSLPGKNSPKDWDFAAPEAILRASGGAITTENNFDLIYDKKDFKQGGIIIASNCKENHNIICQQIRQVLKQNNIYPFNS